jgi:predicted N-acetyltransferase YhbS
MPRLRNPSYDELDEVYNLLNKVFHYEDVGLNPAFVMEQLRVLDTENILVIEEDDQIVSHLFLKPYKIDICGAVLKGAEVGGLVSDEKYRQRGFASTLLKEAIRRIVEMGCDISTLGGDRNRYARWGWEHGGMTRTYTLTDRSVRNIGDCKVSELKRYESPEPNLKRRIIEAYEKQAIHMVRTKVDHNLTYDVPKLLGTNIWTFESADKGFAYMVTLRSDDQKNMTIREYGGDPQVLAVGIRGLFDVWNLRKATVSSPGVYTEFTPFLEKVSQGWSVHPSRQINIIDLKGCLQKLLPVAAKLAENVLEGVSTPHSLTLEVSETKQKANILFSSGCRLTDKEGESLILDKCQMVRLLFGQNKPSSVFRLAKRIPSYLDLILPLPFHEWGTDTR